MNPLEALRDIVINEAFPHILYAAGFESRLD